MLNWNSSPTTQNVLQQTLTPQNAISDTQSPPSSPEGEKKQPAKKRPINPSSKDGSSRSSGLNLEEEFAVNKATIEALKAKNLLLQEKILEIEMDTSLLEAQLEKEKEVLQEAKQAAMGDALLTTAQVRGLDPRNIGNPLNLIGMGTSFPTPKTLGADSIDTVSPESQQGEGPAQPTSSWSSLPVWNTFSFRTAPSTPEKPETNSVSTVVSEKNEPALESVPTLENQLSTVEAPAPQQTLTNLTAPSTLAAPSWLSFPGWKK